jgi:hypothetical protein
LRVEARIAVVLAHSFGDTFQFERLHPDKADRFKVFVQVLRNDVVPGTERVLKRSERPRSTSLHVASTEQQLDNILQYWEPKKKRVHIIVQDNEGTRHSLSTRRFDLGPIDVVYPPRSKTNKTADGAVSMEQALGSSVVQI